MKITLTKTDLQNIREAAMNAYVNGDHDGLNDHQYISLCFLKTLLSYLPEEIEVDLPDKRIYTEHIE